MKIILSSSDGWSAVLPSSLVFVMDVWSSAMMLLSSLGAASLTRDVQFLSLIESQKSTYEMKLDPVGMEKHQGSCDLEMRGMVGQLTFKLTRLPEACAR